MGHASHDPTCLLWLLLCCRFGNCTGCCCCCRTSCRGSRRPDGLQASACCCRVKPCCNRLLPIMRDILWVFEAAMRLFCLDGLLDCDLGAVHQCRGNQEKHRQKERMQTLLPLPPLSPLFPLSFSSHLYCVMLFCPLLLMVWCFHSFRHTLPHIYTPPEWPEQQHKKQWPEQQHKKQQQIIPLYHVLSGAG